jgi:archaellin
MSIGSMIVLAAIVLAFALFAAVLAWEDYCAQLAHRIRDRDRKEASTGRSCEISDLTKSGP